MDVLVVGWDAATEKHLSRFDLPFLESLPHGGELLPEYPFDKAGYISSANAWTTLSTGASFEEHGMLGFVYGPYSDHPAWNLITKIATQQWLPPLLRRIMIGRVLGTLGSGEKGSKGEKIDSADIEFKRIWEYLYGDGLIYGLPLTYPTWETNGVMVSGIPAPKPSEASSPVVYPSEYEEFVYDDEDVGYYVEMNSPVNDSSVAEEPYCAAHQTRMEANARKYTELYEETESDHDFEFGFLMLRGLDDIMHATTDVDILEKSYELIDTLTSDVVEAIDPDATLVLSDHGMRPASDYRFDKDMRMDHDTRQGVWGATEPLNLERHLDVVPALLEYLGVEEVVPQGRGAVDLVMSESDQGAVQERLEDLGYA
ncbi:alkaline phosphatase family protein [Haloquadratum walsbyi]|uniref:Phosphodiesterase/pyrophosphatase family protein n=1 Tax=Haloquadratum walsbyi (strain DSM 16790 / HBSQ001) TaxID=362976 RepID=Q18EI9_HALWD|nr:alkaline phosphatase family protein [Haloquadratum walsbyi]CAJ53635.1 phosphodiesterase/pyrophosphatase family protein [Haloquadratum walsbyi DSM 16790]